MDGEVEAGDVADVADVLDVIATNVRDSGQARAEPPLMVVVIAEYGDGVRETFYAGPGYTAEGHLRLLGQAGLDAAKQMGILDDKEHSPIIVPYFTPTGAGH